MYADIADCLGIPMPVLNNNIVGKQNLEEDWNSQAKVGEIR
jgi:hypothetical protein